MFLNIIIKIDIKYGTFNQGDLLAAIQYLNKQTKSEILVKMFKIFGHQ